MDLHSAERAGSGECVIETGFWDDVCKCEINEALRCSQTLPPRPVKTEAETRFEN